MERLVLVHGSVTNGATTWSAQQPLAGRYRLCVLERPGFPPGPPVERVDFEEHADWVAERLEPGDHLAGHSYGGVISLLAAARFPELRSLTVVEPPCFDVARDHPAVKAFCAARPRSSRARASRSGTCVASSRSSARPTILLRRSRPTSSRAPGR